MIQSSGVLTTLRINGGNRCYSGITQFDPLNPAFELVLTTNHRQGLTCGNVAELRLVGG